MTTTSVTTRWFPQGLTSSVLEAARISRVKAAADANAHATAKEAGAILLGDSLVPTGKLGTIMEKGARPHIEAPKGKPYLYLKGLGVFTSAPVEHPGSPPKPYVRPAAARWANGGFQTTARPVLAARGFH